MARKGLVGVLVVAAFAGLVGIAAISTLLFGFGTSQSSGYAPCGAVVTGGDSGGGAEPVDIDDLDDEQRSQISLIMAIGKQRNLPPRAWQIAIQAGMTESRMRNLGHGDRDSLGIFQMRPSQGWGTPAEVTDPVYQVNKFYDVLLAVPGWETRRPGDSAQAVERSAFPQRYHRWEVLAVRAIEAGGESIDPGNCSAGTAVPPSEAAARAISFALGEVGKPYVWGATGPGSYDCSGLMLRAYESAGVTLPRTSREQYWAGSQVPVDQAQPGDMLFWAYDTSDPESIHHVAMYLGDGQMVEAANPAVPLRQRAVSFGEDEMMSWAVRPGLQHDD